jgi:hypothetical protein
LISICVCSCSTHSRSGTWKVSRLKGSCTCSRAREGRGGGAQQASQRGGSAADGVVREQLPQPGCSPLQQLLRREPRGYAPPPRPPAQTRRKRRRPSRGGGAAVP